MSTTDTLVDDLSQSAAAYGAYSTDALYTAMADVARLHHIVLGTQLSLLQTSIDREGPEAAIAARSAQTACSVARATTMVALARKLTELPLLAGMVAAGLVPYERLVYLVDCVTPSTDAAFLETQWWCSLAELRRLAEGVRAHARDAREAHDKRELRMQYRAGMMRLSGLFPRDAGEVIDAALQRAIDAQDPAVGHAEQSAYYQRRADALEQLASQAVANDRDADRATVVAFCDLGSARTMAGRHRAGDTDRAGGAACRDTREGAKLDKLDYCSSTAGVPETNGPETNSPETNSPENDIPMMGGHACPDA